MTLDEWKDVFAAIGAAFKPDTLIRADGTYERTWPGSGETVIEGRLALPQLTAQDCVDGLMRLAQLERELAEKARQ